MTSEDSRNTPLLCFHAFSPYLGSAAVGLLFWQCFGWSEAILWVPITPIGAALLACCPLSLLGLLSYILKLLVHWRKPSAFFEEQWNVAGIILHLLSGVIFPLIIFLPIVAK